MTMIYFAIALFTLAAVFGLLILIKWLKNRQASRAVVYSHGIFAAVALVILVVFALQNPAGFPKVSLALFVISAIVGFYMFFRDLKQQVSPAGLAIAHALVAVAGLLALLVFTFS